LLAAAGWTNTTIARHVGVCVDTVRKWRHRWWVQPGTASPGDEKRSGRPPSFTPVQVAEVKALACQPPEASGVPPSRWSCPDLAAQVVADGIAASVSPSTVRRWLAEDAIKPWQYQSWIFITDPNFAAKAAGSLTCTTGSGTENRCQQTTMSSPPMRRPQSKLGAGATPACPQARPG
jgi:transposase